MKYNSKQVAYDNILFDSESECLYYQQLQELEKQGKIKDIKVHYSFVLIPPFMYQGKQIKGVVYTPDFVYHDSETNKDIVVEIKGFARPDYEIRLKLWKYYHGKYYDFIELTYTKTLGFRESKDSKKEMKKIREERVKERAIKENAQKQAKIKRIEERLIKLQSKSKLSPIDLKSIKYNELKLKELKGE